MFVYRREFCGHDCKPPHSCFSTSISMSGACLRNLCRSDAVSAQQQADTAPTMRALLLSRCCSSRRLGRFAYSFLRRRVKVRDVEAETILDAFQGLVGFVILPRLDKPCRLLDPARGLIEGRDFHYETNVNVSQFQGIHCLLVLAFFEQFVGLGNTGG